MPWISQPDYQLAIAKTEEAIARCEQAITRQLILIETLTADGREANRIRELRRIAEEHVAELYVSLSRSSARPSPCPSDRSIKELSIVGAGSRIVAQAGVAS